MILQHAEAELWYNYTTTEIGLSCKEKIKCVMNS